MTLLMPTGSNFAIRDICMNIPWTSAQTGLPLMRTVPMMIPPLIPTEIHAQHGMIPIHLIVDFMIPLISIPTLNAANVVVDAKVTIALLPLTIPMMTIPALTI